MYHTKKHVVALLRAYLEGDAESDKKSAGTHTRHEFVDSVNGMAVFCGARGASRGVRKSLEGLEEGLRKVLEAILPPHCSSMVVRVAAFPFLKF